MRAEQPGDGNYAAVSADRTFQVEGENQTTWRARLFSATEAADDRFSGPNADPDGDGLSNQLEFAFNLNPKFNDSMKVLAGAALSGTPRVFLDGGGAGTVLSIEYLRRKAATAPGVAYAAQFSGDLDSATGWSTASAEIVTPLDSTWERVKVVDPSPTPGQRFGRVKVIVP